MKKDLAILIIVVTAALAFMMGYSLAPTGAGGRSASPAASAPGYGDEAGRSAAPGYGDEAAPAKAGRSAAPGYGEVKAPRKAAAPGYND
jgi:hypothetical protein